MEEEKHGAKVSSRSRKRPRADWNRLTLTSQGKEIWLNRYQGEIKCLLYARIEGLDVLISGSADRTIKLWEPKNTKSNPCF